MKSQWLHVFVFVFVCVCVCEREREREKCWCGLQQVFSPAIQPCPSHLLMVGVANMLLRSEFIKSFYFSAPTLDMHILPCFSL